MKFDAFIGQSNPAGSPNVDIEHTVNLYLEAAGEGVSAPKAKNVLYARPGVKQFCTLPASPCRGVWSNQSRMFAVGGANLYEVFATTTGTVTPTNGSVSVLAGTLTFDTNTLAGTIININGVNYTVATVPTTGLLTLTTPFSGTSATQSATIQWGSTSLRGSVGSDGLPVLIFPARAGNQLVVVSNGALYVDNGAGPVAATFTDENGNPQPLTGQVTATVVGGHPAIIHWESGDQFIQTMAGQTITINGSSYVVDGSKPISPTSLQLLTGNPGAGPYAYSCVPTLSAGSGASLDGYAIVSQVQSKQYNFSALNNALSWDATDYDSKEGYPDNILALLADHEVLWIWGTDTTEVHQSTGQASVFQRIQSGFIHHGLAAQFCPVRIKEGVAWLQTEPNRGGCTAVYAQGFTPVRISTHAVESVWNTYATVSDAIAFSYSEAGHEFWVISFPTANATWVWDATAGTWVEWSWWNGSSNDRIRQAFHAFWETHNTHVVGDWQNGNLYYQSIAYTTDAGTAINWTRIAPHISSEQLWNFYSKFQLDMEVGQSTSSPSVSLSWSDDGGHTWSTPRAGTPSDSTYAGRLIWWRLGRSRSRAFKVTGTVPAAGPRTAIIQALLDITLGIR